MIITDVDLARLWLHSWKPEPGEYTAPAATVLWDGTALHCQPTGTALDPAAALLCPALARALGLAARATTPQPVEPTIAALVADYGAATAPLRSSAVSIASEAVFLGRLQTGCRKCLLWAEADREGRGRCQSVRCHCSRRLLWLASETCPEGHWPLKPA